MLPSPEGAWQLRRVQVLASMLACPSSYRCGAACGAVFERVLDTSRMLADAKLHGFTHVAGEICTHMFTLTVLPRTSVDQDRSSASRVSLGAKMKDIVGGASQTGGSKCCTRTEARESPTAT